ncbi:MAG: right-handed parallel beta-helix repeat-containing protein, partial [Nanoarchaeota archaeon]
MGKRGKRDLGENSLFKTDASLLSNTDKIRVLKSNISEADERQNQIIAKVAEYKLYLASEKVTYAEYEWLLNHYLRGKSLNEWLFYYENYKLNAKTAIIELERICEEKPSENVLKTPQTIERKVSSNIPGINAAYLIPLFVVFALLGAYFLGNAITGFVTVEFPVNESWDIGSSYVRVSMNEYTEDKALAEFVNGSIVSVDLEKFSIPASGTLYVDLIVSGVLADSRKVEYELPIEENITEEIPIEEPIAENITEIEIPIEENITEIANITEAPLENVTEEIPSEENITEEINITGPEINITLPENITETINITKPLLNITVPLNITLPENISNATIEFNLSELNLTHIFNDEAIGGIRTGEVVLWQREIVGGDTEAESFYKEAENIVLVKKSDLEESKGKKGGSAMGAMSLDNALKREAKNKAREIIEKKGIKLDKEEAGNESYARIEEPELGVDYFIFYETPAPSLDIAEPDVPIEEDNKITVVVSAVLDYTNVTVAYPLVNYKSRQLTVYWVVNSSRIKMESVGEDVDGDGVEDNLLWIAPHLSNQTFELEITVINVYSYPAVGENWTVYFNTTGTGDLSIMPFNDLLDGPWEEMKQDNEATSNEMKFLELYCGDERVTDDAYVVTNETERRYGDISDEESIFTRKLLLPDYNCDGKTSSIINKMNVPGYISLNFTFANDYGSVSSYAYDPDYGEFGNKSNFNHAAGYSWIELAGTGATSLSFTDYDSSTSATVNGWNSSNLGFTFNYFGNSYTNINISTNGYMAFDAINASTSTNQPLPYNSGAIAGYPENIIAPYWDVILVDGTKQAYVYTQTRGASPNRQFVVEWYNVTSNNVGCLNKGGLTFEAILYENSNDIKFQYLDVIGNETSSICSYGSSGSVGIENKSGTAGVSYSYNSPLLNNQSTISFYAPFQNYANGNRNYFNMSRKWEEINTTGTALSFPNTATGGNYTPIGFNFSFFGRTYTSVNVTTEGYMTFDLASDIVEESQPVIPSTDGPESIIAPWWDGLNTAGSDSTGNVFVYTAGIRPYRRFIVEWYNVIPDAKTPSDYSNMNFQAILYETTNNIRFNYYDTIGSGIAGYADYGGSATIGIEDASGTKGLMWSYNEASVFNQSSILFSTETTCVTPRDDLAINEDTLLCPGYYVINDHGSDGVLQPNNNAGVLIQCDNTTIVNNGDGTGYGLYGLGDYNLTIRGCDIRNYTAQIYSSGGSHWTIQRNNLTGSVSSTGAAISLLNGENFTISHNNITAFGTSTNGEIELNTVNSSRIYNNIIKSIGTSMGIHSMTSAGYLYSLNVTGNTIEINSSSARGINIEAKNSFITYNDIKLTGSTGGIDCIGIALNSANLTYIAYNNITTNCMTGIGIRMASAENATIYKNWIYANGTASNAIGYATSNEGANISLNNVTSTGYAIITKNQGNIYGNIIRTIVTNNYGISTVGSNNRVWMNNIESIYGITNSAGDTFCVNYNGVEEGNFYAAGTAPADIPSDDCGAANMTYPDGGEAFNASYINVTWKKQSHSPLKPLWYSFAFSNDSAVKWQELRSVWGYQGVYNFSVNATYKRYRFQSQPKLINGTYLTIPKIANITRAVFKVEYIASSVFKNITGYTGNASFQRQYELFGNASQDAFGRSIAIADVNNDGIKDIISGALNADICTGGTADCGGAMIWLGYDSTKGESFSSKYDFYLKGINSSDNAGRNVASCDVNNDSISDIILGVPGMENGTGYTGSCSGIDCGGVIVYFGINAGGAFNSIPDLELYGMNASDGFALGENQAPVACGDVNNDSIADIVWGAPGADSNASSGQDKGSAIVYFGKPAGQAWNTTPDLELFGVNDSDLAGFGIGVGDVNNDGID